MIIKVENAVSPQAYEDGTEVYKGNNNLFTIQIVGTEGGVCSVYGSNFNPSLNRWTTVVDLTVTGGSDSAVWQATWGYYKVTPSAGVSYNLRGHV